MSTLGRAAASAWLGFSLAAIFFYPLAAALDSDPYYLQWQSSHSTETLVALAILALTFAALIFVVWPRKGRGATLALAAIALIPMLSLGAGVSRQLPIDDALRNAWESAGVRYGIPAVVAAALAAAFALAPAALDRFVRRVLFVLSPISIVVVVAIVRGGSAPGLPIALERAASGTFASCPPVLALLFDELSFAYLYEGTQIRSSYPAFQRFSSTATNYLNARAPGEETMVSVPGYLAGESYDNIRLEGTRLEYELGSERAAFDPRKPDGLFATARRAGYSPEIVGYYFPYCEMLGPLVDRCRSFSFYNISTVQTAFSPLHPVETTLILWPRQFPLGLLKNPPFARLQRATVEETTAFASRVIPTNPVFRLVHYSIPHLPFVYTRDGYDPPFNPLLQRPDTAYANQIDYADRLLGELMDGLRASGAYDRTTIAVFSDHGFRSGGRETDSRHVPFIVKHAGQTTRMDVTDTVRGEIVLRELVSECRATTPSP